MERFSVLTQNLGGHTEEYLSKLTSFLTLVKIQSPDIVAVQGCSRFMFEQLMREMGLAGYKKFLPEIMVHRDAGEAIFSKLPFLEKMHVKFPKTGSNKGLTFVKLDVWGDNVGLWICTTDFEKEYAIRKLQIASYLPHILRSIPDVDNIIFAGTTHILTYHESSGQDILPPNKYGEWTDMWYEVGDDEVKYTLDHTTNLLVSPPFKDRPDRVWVRGHGASIIATDMKLFKANSDEGERVISPHYGVLVHFEKCM